MSTEVAICVGPVAKAKLQAAVQAIVDGAEWKALGEFEMVSPEAAVKLRGIWKDAVDLGAKVLTPASPSGAGHEASVPATVLTDVTPEVSAF